MNWIVENNKDLEAVKKLAKELNIDSTLSSMLVNRKIQTFNQAKEFFRPSIDKLHDPFLMKDMNLAVDRILRAIDAPAIDHRGPKFQDLSKRILERIKLI
jgi:single-stranded-DNA-specific exonuclease